MKARLTHYTPTLNPAEPIGPMKRPRPNQLLFSLIVFATAALPALAVTVTTLPASLAAPLNSSTNRGFLIRTAQGWTTNGPMANSYTRAYKQINGTLRDTNNLIVVNAVLAGTHSDGSFTFDTIN